MDTVFFAKALANLVAIIDPIGALPFFLALLPAVHAPRDVRRAALIATGTALVAMTMFALTGERVLTFFDVGLPAFRIAGGILLFAMSFSMLQGSVSPVKHSRPVEDEGLDELRSGAVVPLAIPILVGPGTLSTVILLAHQADTLPRKASLALVLITAAAVIFLSLLLAAPLQRRLGMLGIRVVTRLMGLIVAAMAVQFVIDGLSEVFPAWTAVA